MNFKCTATKFAKPLLTSSSSVLEGSLSQIFSILLHSQNIYYFVL